MADAYERAIGLIITATIPLAVLLAALATSVIRFLYGAKWLPAATPLRFLLVLAVGRVVIQTTLDFIAADGAPMSILKVQVAWLLMLIPALTIGAHRYGIAGVGVGHMVVVVVWVVPLLAIVLRRRCEVDLGRVARQFVRPVLAAAGALVILELTLRVVSDPTLQLFLGGAAGFATYAALIVPFNPAVKWGLNQFRSAPKPIALSEA